MPRYQPDRCWRCLLRTGRPRHLRTRSFPRQPLARLGCYLARVARRSRNSRGPRGLDSWGVRPAAGDAGHRLGQPPHRMQRAVRATAFPAPQARTPAYVSLSDLPDLVPASPRRQSVRFGVRRQKAYRTRTKNGEPAKPLNQPEEQVIHLDEIAGTLHYHSVPIIVLTAPSQRLAGFPATDTSRDSRTKAIGHWTRAQAT